MLEEDMHQINKHTNPNITVYLTYTFDWIGETKHMGEFLLIADLHQ